MRADPRFLGLPLDFWAYVKALSESLGYSGPDRDLRRYEPSEILGWVEEWELSVDVLSRPIGDGATYLGLLESYLNYRAEVLEGSARPNLMNEGEARAAFRGLKKELRPKCLLPLNKQKGKKRHEAYLTCIVSMLTESALEGCDFDQDPRKLATIWQDGRVVYTMSRRMDGAFPSTRNPSAVWEVKEYYGTTTFGSRIADGVYETILDGRELAELREREGVHVRHYLMVDDYRTWWQQGRSYLCRIVDMLHAGYVDEVLFGREVLVRWPAIVRSWLNS